MKLNSFQTAKHPLKPSQAGPSTGVGQRAQRKASSEEEAHWHKNSQKKYHEDTPKAPHYQVYDEDDGDNQDEQGNDDLSGIEINETYQKPSGNAHYNPNIHSKKRKYEGMSGYSSNIGPMKGTNKRRKANNLGFK